jgi:hypothetical protein
VAAKTHAENVKQKGRPAVLVESLKYVLLKLFATDGLQ